MKTATSLHAFSLSKQLAFTALFASLCLVGTLVISIPLPFGYFNVGDVFVLLAAWFLGPLYGAVAAGTGSALCGHHSRLWNLRALHLFYQSVGRIHSVHGM